FFQAEDGIRDDLVTGVQTCALPIWLHRAVQDGGRLAPRRLQLRLPGPPLQARETLMQISGMLELLHRPWPWYVTGPFLGLVATEIGRASCRERVEVEAAGADVKR